MPLLLLLSLLHADDGGATATLLVVQAEKRSAWGLMRAGSETHRVQKLRLAGGMNETASVTQTAVDNVYMETSEKIYIALVLLANSSSCVCC